MLCYRFLVKSENKKSIEKNQQNKKQIGVTFSFSPLGAYTGVEGRFTNEKGDTITKEISVKANGGSTTAYLVLSENNALGAIALPDEFVLGYCTVTIREIN